MCFDVRDPGRTALSSSNIVSKLTGCGRGAHHLLAERRKRWNSILLRPVTATFSDKRKVDAFYEMNAPLLEPVSTEVEPPRTVALEKTVQPDS